MRPLRGDPRDHSVPVVPGRKCATGLQRRDTAAMDTVPAFDHNIRRRDQVIDFRVVSCLAIRGGAAGKG